MALVVGVESIHTLGQFLGALAMVGAAAFYALGGFVVKRRYGRLTSMQTSFVSLSVAVADDAADRRSPPRRPRRPGSAPSPPLIALGAVGTALAFVIFYKLIAEVGAGRASLVSYLAPGVALFYGAVFLDEAITAGRDRRPRADPRRRGARLAPPARAASPSRYRPRSMDLTPVAAGARVP